MPAADTGTAARAGRLGPRSPAAASSISGASIGTSNMPALRSSIGAPYQPAHRSANQLTPSAKVASAAQGRAPSDARSAAAANSAAPVRVATTARPGEAVAYALIAVLRSPSVAPAELTAIASPRPPRTYASLLIPPRPRAAAPRPDVSRHPLRSPASDFHRAPPRGHGAHRGRTRSSPPRRG